MHRSMIGSIRRGEERSYTQSHTYTRARTHQRRPCAGAVSVAGTTVAAAVSFFPFRPFFFPSFLPFFFFSAVAAACGLCVGAYEWGASLRDVTRGVGTSGESGGWSARVSEEWVGSGDDGETLGWRAGGGWQGGGAT